MNGKYDRERERERERLENLKGRDNFEKLDTDRMMLTWLLKEYTVFQK
jgi:hypothetical protein